MRGRIERPHCFSRSRLERSHNFQVTLAVKQDYFPANNHRRREARAHLLLPRKLGRPTYGLACIDPVAVRTQKLGPVVRHCRHRRQSEKKHASQTTISRRAESATPGPGDENVRGLNYGARVSRPGERTSAPTTRQGNKTVASQTVLTFVFDPEPKALLPEGLPLGN